MFSNFTVVEQFQGMPVLFYRQNTVSKIYAVGTTNTKTDSSKLKDWIESVAFKERKNYHSKNTSGPQAHEANKLKRPVKQCYNVQRAGPIVGEVVRNCNYCNDQFTNRRVTGPLVPTT